jgi:transposase-like protein
VISNVRRIKDAQNVFQKAKQKSHDKKPRFVITDGLSSYHKAINKEFHTVKKETVHIGSVGIRGKQFENTTFDNNLVERLHGTIRDRNRTQRGLKSVETPFTNGHQLYYNFIKPHEALNYKTPSEEAGIAIEGDNK